MSRSDDDTSLDELGALLREREETMETDLDQDPFGPLAAEEQSALLANVRSRLLQESAPQTAAPVRLEPLRAEVVNLAEARARKWPRVVAALSVAAAAMFAVLWPRHEGEALPEFALVLPSADASHRAGDEGPELPDGKIPHYVLGRTLEVLLRPATRVVAELDARAYVEREGALVQLPLLPKLMPGGGVLFSVRTGAGTEFREPSDQHLHFVVASRGSLPNELTSPGSIPSHAKHVLFSLRLEPPR